VGKLDNTARVMVEQIIDNIMQDPIVAEETYRFILKKQGIEPNLETILSFITGLLNGAVEGFYTFTHERLLNSDERNRLAELLKRRAFELRQAFMSTRIES
jgi:hypothetical protein